MLLGTNVTKGREHAKSESGKGDTTVIQRANNFASASRRILTLCNSNEKLPVAMSIPTLTPFGGRPMCGMPCRPALLNPKAVFREIATQALTYRKILEPGSPTGLHWHWPPRYVAMPPLMWNPTQIRSEEVCAKRITGKRPPRNGEYQTPKRACPRRIRGKRPPNQEERQENRSGIAESSTPREIRKRIRDDQSPQESDQDDSVQMIDINTERQSTRSFVQPTRAEGRGKKPAKRKNEEPQRNGTPLPRKHRQEGASSSWECAVYTTTATPRRNRNLKRDQQRTHPKMRKKPRFRPHAHVPKRKRDDQESHPSERNSKATRPSERSKRPLQDRQEPNPKSKKSCGSRPQALCHEKQLQNIGLPPITRRKCEHRHDKSSSSTTILYGDGELDDDLDLQ
jgi:hypothetical protein